MNQVATRESSRSLVACERCRQKKTKCFVPKDSDESSCIRCSRAHALCIFASDSFAHWKNIATDHAAPQNTRPSPSVISTDAHLAQGIAPNQIFSEHNEPGAQSTAGMGWSARSASVQCSNCAWLNIQCDGNNPCLSCITRSLACECFYYVNAAQQGCSSDITDYQVYNIPEEYSLSKEQDHSLGIAGGNAAQEQPLSYSNYESNNPQLAYSMSLESCYSSTGTWNYSPLHPSGHFHSAGENNDIYPIQSCQCTECVALFHSP
jgi:hypothetical protein